VTVKQQQEVNLLCTYIQTLSVKGCQVYIPPWPSYHSVGKEAAQITDIQLLSAWQTEQI